MQQLTVDDSWAQEQVEDGRLTRQEAQALITAAGGRVTSSVTRKTDYVVAGADPGSKYAQAQRLEIPIISEEDLHLLVRSAALPVSREEG